MLVTKTGVNNNNIVKICYAVRESITHFPCSAQVFIVLNYICKLLKTKERSENGFITSIQKYFIQQDKISRLQRELPYFTFNFWFPSKFETFFHTRFRFRKKITNVLCLHFFSFIDKLKQNVVLRLTYYPLYTKTFFDEIIIIILFWF